jgi:hypothetical protein
MAKNKSPKRGRPPKDLAGDVQARILMQPNSCFSKKVFGVPALTTRFSLPETRLHNCAPTDPDPLRAEGTGSGSSRAQLATGSEISQRHLLTRTFAKVWRSCSLPFPIKQAQAGRHARSLRNSASSLRHGVESGGDLLGIPASKPASAVRFSEPRVWSLPVRPRAELGSDHVFGRKSRDLPDAQEAVVCPHRLVRRACCYGRDGHVLIRR